MIFLILLFLGIRTTISQSLEDCCVSEKGYSVKFGVFGCKSTSKNIFQCVNASGSGWWYTYDLCPNGQECRFGVGFENASCYETDGSDYSTSHDQPFPVGEQACEDISDDDSDDTIDGVGCTININILTTIGLIILVYVFQ